MKQLLRFGDVHFSSAHKYNHDAGESFIEFVENQDFGKPEDLEALFVGDVGDKDANPGDVVDQFIKLFSVLTRKFSTVYVLQGNHDVKHYRYNEQYSLKFLTTLYSNVVLITEFQELTTKNGFKVLAMPHFNLHKGETPMYQVYSNLGDEFYSKEYDLVTGHWEILGTTPSPRGIDISRLKSKAWAIGHVHTRVNPKYTGSIWPCNIVEVGGAYPRAIMILNEDGTEDSILLPKFLDFVRVEYPNELPESEAIGGNTVYVIDGDFGKALEKYEGKYIIEGRVKANNGDETTSEEEIDDNLSLTDLFDKYLEDKNVELDRQTYNYIYDILEKYQER